MSQLPHLLAAVEPLADVIPNPAPKDPTNGSVGVSLILGYIKYGVLFICAAMFIVAGGMIASAKVFETAHPGSKGKLALMGSIVGAILAAVGIPVIQGIFNAAS